MANGAVVHIGLGLGEELPFRRPMLVAQLETLTHMFMGCPSVSQPVEAWHAVTGVWPPRDAWVVLADDDT
jgi:hypothetical protein